jgi:hypothetical protein
LGGEGLSRSLQSTECFEVSGYVTDPLKPL